MNRWKVAFFSAVCVWLVTLAIAAYAILDQGVTITYMSDGYSQCEKERDALRAAAKSHHAPAR